MSRDIEIRDGAFIVSDAHYSPNRPQFLSFLKKILGEELKTTQLILAGDMFDALFGGVSYTYELNKEAVDVLNKISLNIEVIYLEGNHDFNLKNIFPNIKIFPISVQPVKCKIKDKSILLAHGDIKSTLKYRLYTAVIRNPFVLYILKTIDIISGHYILKKVDDHLSKKDDCKEISGFEDFINNRLSDMYKSDYFIEGHFHQDKTFTMKDSIYINLGAFACNQRYFIVELSNGIKFLQEKFS